MAAALFAGTAPLIMHACFDARIGVRAALNDLRTDVSPAARATTHMESLFIDTKALGLGAPEVSRASGVHVTCSRAAFGAALIAIRAGGETPRAAAESDVTEAPTELGVRPKLFGIPLGLVYFGYVVSLQVMLRIKNRGSDVAIINGTLAVDGRKVDLEPFERSVDDTVQAASQATVVGQLGKEQFSKDSNDTVRIQVDQKE